MITKSKPLILNFAPTGMVPTREMSPHVPLQPKEIIRDVLASAELGITIVHLHARDVDGIPTHRKKIYSKIITGIREQRPEIVICVSCSGRNVRDPRDRADVLELTGDVKPDMASLTLASLNFPRQASVNSPETIQFLAQRMLERDIRPEIEIFDLGMVNVLHYLLRKRWIEAPIYANLLFGNLASAQADLLDIGTVIAKLPSNTTYSLAGLGEHQIPMAAIGAAMADGVRIGLEDNLWLDSQRTQLATNLDLVMRVHQMSANLNRTIMTPHEFRQQLQLTTTSHVTRFAA